MADYMADFIEARYHLSVAERMLTGYNKYPEKRFLIGVIKEGAKATSRIIRAFLIYDKTHGNFHTFLRKVAPKYLDDSITINLAKMLEIERAHKISRVEFARGNKIIFLIDGKYMILTVSRLGDFVKSISDAVSVFATNIKR